MFQTPEALDKTRHAGLRFAPADDFSYAAGLSSAPLAAVEVLHAAACYPVLFAADGTATPLAVLGLAGRNVYLDEQGRWTAPYIPAHVRRYPFVLTTGQEVGKFFIAIDADAPHFKSGQGEPLLTETGELGETATKAVEMLRAFEEDMQQTRAALGQLEEKGVLVDKQLTVKDGSTSRIIGGFRVVDEDKLKALDDATLAKWARSNVLQVIHAHWASLRHLNAVAIAAGRPADTH